MRLVGSVRIRMAAAGALAGLVAMCTVTAAAAPASAAAPAPAFNILKGGNLKGTYTIPQFGNCGLATPLINLTIPGPGNTITLTLGKATIG